MNIAKTALLSATDNSGRADPLLQISQLRKMRKSPDGIFELLVDDFDVTPGEFLTIVGASGSGKSTLMDILALILRPDSAANFALCPRGGRKIDLLSAGRSDISTLRRKHLGYVLQNGGLLEFLTVRENIALPARLNCIKDVSASVMSIAVELGIEDLLNCKPRQLSGGQRQRAAIARALVHQPAIVLADEPTSALDRFRAVALVQMLQKCCSDHGAALVMVTHDLELVREKTDRSFTFIMEKVPGSSSIISRFIRTPAEATHQF